MNDDQIRRLEDLFTADGLVLEKYTENHWRIRYQGTAVDYWPRTGTAQAFAKVFKPKDPRNLASALRSGRIDMPGEAQAATCRDCSEAVWWVESQNTVNPEKSGRKISLNSDGTAHWGTCKAKKKNRGRRTQHQAHLDFISAAKEAFDDPIPF